MAPQVIRAMEEASGRYVSIQELQEAAGRQIAGWLGAEAALVTCGCASALTLGTAACVTGCDEEKMNRLPDTRGMKNEVVLQRSHRVEYDHAVRNVGVRLIQVESRQELEAAIGPGTAMLFFLNMAQHRGQIQREEFVEIARNAGVPCLIDAAADIPPAENLTDLIALGFDLAAFSGGKGIRGPQSSGLLLGPQGFDTSRLSERIPQCRPHRPGVQGRQGGDHRSLESSGTLLEKRSSGRLGTLGAAASGDRPGFR